MAMLQLNDIFSRVWGHLLAGATIPPAEEFWAGTRGSITFSGGTLLAEAYWGTESRMIDLGFPSFVYDKELYDALRDFRPQDVLQETSFP